jgi:hypothetical protein
MGSIAVMETNSSAPVTQSPSLVSLAAAACIPLECATAISAAATGFVVWVPFELDWRVDEESTCTMRVFSSREKAMKAYKSTVLQHYEYAPYRMHHSGSPDKIYIYTHVHNREIITITNIAEDLFNLSIAQPNQYVGIKTFSDVKAYEHILDEN